MRNKSDPLRILLVGEKGSGKTTLLVRATGVLKEKGVRCCGVLSVKILDKGGEIIGIDALDLSPEPPVRKLLARTDTMLDGPTIGMYRFSNEGLRFGQEALNRGARHGDVVFADELGPLEMRGEGFANILEMALDVSTPPMVIAVRPALAAEAAGRLAGVSTGRVDVSADRREGALNELVKMLHEAV